MAARHSSIWLTVSHSSWLSSMLCLPEVVAAQLGPIFFQRLMDLGQGGGETRGRWPTCSSRVAASGSNLATSCPPRTSPIVIRSVATCWLRAEASGSSAARLFETADQAAIGIQPVKAAPAERADDHQQQTDAGEQLIANGPALEQLRPPCRRCRRVGSGMPSLTGESAGGEV